MKMKSATKNSKSLENKKFSFYLKILLLILIVGYSTFLRFKCTDYGFPLLLHSDEPAIVERAAKIVSTGKLNPSFFNYPSGFIYAQAGFYAVVYKVGKLFGHYKTFRKIPQSDLHYWGRLLTVLSSTLTLLFVYLASRKLFNYWTGFFSVAIVGFNVLHLAKSHFVAVDVPMTLWVTVSFYFSAKILKEDSRIKNYLLASVAVGLAAGTKYNGALCILSLILSHFLTKTSWKTQILDPKIFISLLVSAITFVITTPFALLDNKKFLNDFLFKLKHYSTGHIGFNNTESTYLEYANDILKCFGWSYVVLGITGLFFLLFTKKYKEIMFILVLPILYYITVGKFKVHFDRNIVPVVPGIAIFCGVIPACLATRLEDVDFSSLLSSAVKLITLRNHLSGVKFLTHAVVFLFFSFFLYGTYTAVKNSHRYVNHCSLPDTRLLSTNWIDETLEKGTHIILDYYTPRPNTKKFHIRYLGIGGFARGIIKTKKYDYIITSSTDYSRFFKNKKKYPLQYKRYRQIFEENDLVRKFVPIDGKVIGPTISILKVKK